MKPFLPSINTHSTPYLRGFWSTDRIAVLLGVCLLLPFAVSLADRGNSLGFAFVVSLAVITGWQLIFSLLRRQKLGLDGVATALIFTILAADALPIWQLALAATFGIVVGELVFGGRGFSIVNPSVVALAFLTFSFTGVVYAQPSPWIGLAALPAGILLIAFSLISWRIVVAVIAGLAVFGVAQVQSIDLGLLNGQFIFLLVFLACDPASSASTNLGRWANGLTIGGLAWVFTPVGGIPTGPEAMVPAILLASIFAPLFDRIVILFNSYSRRRPNV